MAFSIHQPHDKLLKLAMADIVVAKEFFTAHVPSAILDKLDLNSLKLEKETFIDAAYKDTEADIVYSAKMGDTSAYLYLLCEEQTKVDQWLAFRILCYTLRIMELHRKQHPAGFLPLVYPMVVYIGDEQWNAPLDIFPLFGDVEHLAKEWLFKPFQLLDVQRISDDDLHKQMLSGLVAFAMKHQKAVDFKRFLKKLLPWIDQVQLVNDGNLVHVVLRYVIDRSPQGNKDLLIQEAQHYLSEKLRGDVMTIAQQWEEEGIKKGIQIGEQKGIQIGEQKGIQIGKQEGIQIGEQKAMQAFASRLLHRGMSDDEIRTLTGLPLVSIRALRKKKTTRCV